MARVREFRERLNRAVFETDPAALGPWRGAGVATLRIALAVGRDFAEGQLGLRAMSLVYSTLLSLVPLLAISFSVLKAFGVHNRIEPVLLNVLAPLGEKGVEITERTIGFVENVQVGVLGAVGLALLVYTVVSLMQKVEAAFNHIWRVRRQRPLAKRFSDYLSVIVIGPVLVFAAIGLTATLAANLGVERLASVPVAGALIEAVGRLVPYLLVVAAFAFTYVFMPNTRVRLGAALVGALIAGALWQTVGWGFAAFVVTSARYTAVYSAFATLVLFMIWLYLSWLILFAGAEIAFYCQHADAAASGRAALDLSPRLGERLALTVMVLLARQQYRGGAPWTAERVAHRLGLPADVVEDTVETLCRAGLLARTDDDPSGLVAARAPEALQVTEVLAAVRAAGESGRPPPKGLAAEAGVAALAAEADRAVAEALAGRTVRDLALAGETEGGPTPHTSA